MKPGDEDRAKLLVTDDLVRIGAATETVNESADLADTAAAVAFGMAELAPLTLTLTKSSLTLLRPDVEDNLDQVCTAYLSRDAEEAQADFFDKRKPQWRGC